MRPHRGRRHRGFLNQAMHYGREFGRHADVFFRAMGPTLRTIAMSAAPALASAGMPQAADNIPPPSSNQWLQPWPLQ